MRIVDPPQAEIFESWDPYVDFFYTDQRGWIVPDTDKIKSLADAYDFVIANCSSEHWGSERDFPLVARLHDILTEHFAKDFVCLCHDPADQSLRENILYFPFFAWRRAWPAADTDMIARAERTYLFSNLNYHARDFRIANYLTLRHKHYADQCLLSMHNVMHDNHGYDGHFPLTAAENLAWQQTRPELPCEISDGYGPVFDLTHPAFSHTYLHVVSETTVKDKIFLTEKTWQPILAGQLFVIWGNRGIVAHLRDLGVDVFDDVVDHAYDEITDHRDRFGCLHKELDRLATLDWPKIYRVTALRRLINAHKFDSGALVSRYVDELKLRLPEDIV